MSKKKAKQQPSPKAPMTKRELSRWQKEKRQERMALAFVVGTIAIVVGVLLFGFWREVLSRPRETVARIGATAISMGQLVEEIKYRARTLDNQILQADSQLRQLKIQAANDPSQSFLVQYAEQQLQQLQLQRFQLGDGQGVIEEMIERELIKQEVTARGGTVTSGDLDLIIQREFQPQASKPSSTTVTETTGLTPTPSPTPIPADAWKARYQETLTSLGVSDAEFRRFVVEPFAWRQRLQDLIATTVPTTTEQVHARHILVANEADARDIAALLKESPSQFEEIAKARSTDESNKDKGGDLGWFARGAMVAEFEAAAFALQPGQISDVISTTFGFHIIKLEERDANRPLDADQLQQAISQAFNAWLERAKQRSDVQRFFDSAKQLWLNKQIPASQQF